MFKKFIPAAILFIFGFFSLTFANSVEPELHFAKGLLLEYENKHIEALKEYQAAIELDPKADIPYVHAVKSAIQSDQKELAEKLLNTLIELKPQDSQNWVLRGMLSWTQSDIQGALKHYEKALELDPDNAEALLQAANMLKKTDPQRAKFYFKEYVEKAGIAKYYGYYELGVIEYESGKLSDALKYFKKSKDENRLFPEARYSIAHIYELNKNYDLAIREYAELEKLDSLNDRLPEQIGKIYLIMYDEKNAKHYFLKAKSINNSNPAANSYLANLAEKNGDFKLAVKYSRESRLYPSDHSMHIKVSYYLTQLKRNDEALDELIKARKKWPDNAEVIYFLALGYDDAGSTEKAMHLLENLMDKRPDLQKVIFQYGVFAEKLNMVEKSENAFLKIIENNPQNALGLNYLGYMLADRGLKLDKAQGYIEKALEISPQNPAYTDSLAWVYFKKGNTKKSLELITKTLELEKSDKMVWYHAGMIYSKLNDDAKAWYCFKIAAVLDEEFEKSTKELKKLENMLANERLLKFYTDYLNKVVTKYDKLSSICKINARVLGDEFSYNAILKYNLSGSLYLDILDPFYTPVLNMGLGVSGKMRTLKMPENIETANEKQNEKLKKVLSRMFEIMWDYFSGEMLETRGAKISKTSKRIKNERYIIYSDDNAEKITRIKGNKIKLALSDFEIIDDHFIPKTFEFKSFGVKVKIKLNELKTVFPTKYLPLP